MRPWQRFPRGKWEAFPCRNRRGRCPSASMKTKLMLVLVLLQLAFAAGCVNTAKGIQKDYQKAEDKAEGKKAGRQRACARGCGVEPMSVRERVAYVFKIRLGFISGWPIRRWCFLERL